MDNKSLSHTRYKYQYHKFFIPKYHKKQLYGSIRTDVREILATLCKYKDVEIIVGAVCADYVHLSVAILPKISISSFITAFSGLAILLATPSFWRVVKRLLLGLMANHQLNW